MWLQLYAPSKTFNLAGLIGSFHIIYSRYLRDRICSHANATHYNEYERAVHARSDRCISVPGMARNGLEELRAVLDRKCPVWACGLYHEITGMALKLASPEGTYMLFLDCHRMVRKHTGRTMDEAAAGGMLKRCYAGRTAERSAAPASIRMNLALPLSRIEDAFGRLKRYVFL